MCSAEQEKTRTHIDFNEVITDADIKKEQTLQNTAHGKPRTGLPLYRYIMSDIFGSKDNANNPNLQENGEEISIQGSNTT